MAQISLYMNDSVMNSLRMHAEKEGISISKYVGDIIENFERGQSSEWPAGYWDSVYGCLSDEDAAFFIESTSANQRQAKPGDTLGSSHSNSALESAFDSGALNTALDNDLLHSTISSALDPALDDACDWME